MKTVKQIEDKTVGKVGLGPKEVYDFLGGLTEDERQRGRLRVLTWFSFGPPRVCRVTVEVEEGSL